MSDPPASWRESFKVNSGWRLSMRQQVRAFPYDQPPVGRASLLSPADLTICSVTRLPQRDTPAHRSSIFTRTSKRAPKVELLPPGVIEKLDHGVVAYVFEEEEDFDREHETLMLRGCECS
jgi:hypothetical protein